MTNATTTNATITKAQLGLLANAAAREDDRTDTMGRVLRGKVNAYGFPARSIALLQELGLIEERPLHTDARREELRCYRDAEIDKATKLLSSRASSGDAHENAIRWREALSCLKRAAIVDDDEAETALYVTDAGRAAVAR